MAMCDPTAVPIEGGSRLWCDDGGPQHSAGAQFADSIAAPGAAAVSRLWAGRSCSSEPKSTTASQAGSERGAQRRRSTSSQSNHVVGGAVTEPFAIRTPAPSIKDDR